MGPSSCLRLMALLSLGVLLGGCGVKRCTSDDDCDRFGAGSCDLSTGRCSNGTFFRADAGDAEVEGPRGECAALEVGVQQFFAEERASCDFTGPDGPVSLLFYPTIREICDQEFGACSAFERDEIRNIGMCLERSPACSPGQEEVAGTRFLACLSIADLSGSCRAAVPPCIDQSSCPGP